MGHLLNAADFRARARRRLPRGLFDYIDRGTEDELALRQLRAGLDDMRFLPRILAGHTQRDLSTTVLGHHIDSPIIIAPTALAGLVAHDGEVKLARAAARHGIPFTVSTQSITTIEEIRAGAPQAKLWFQLYMWKDRALSYQLLDRVWKSDVTTLVVTADTPVGANREYNTRNRFGIPFKHSVRAAVDIATHPVWFKTVLWPYLRRTGIPVFGHYPSEFRSAITRPAISEAVRLENALNWEDMRELRQKWKGEIVIKGVLAPDDAIKAADLGMSGVIVSAHGGRNLDIAVTPVDALPAIVDAVGNRLDVMADSGARRGSDVLKYLALGAKAVLLGRLPLWGLAVDDEAGADRLLAIIEAEINTTMAMLGIRRPEDCSALNRRQNPQRL